MDNLPQDRARSRGPKDHILPLRRISSPTIRKTFVTRLARTRARMKTKNRFPIGQVNGRLVDSSHLSPFVTHLLTIISRSRSGRNRSLFFGSHFLTRDAPSWSNSDINHTSWRLPHLDVRVFNHNWKQRLDIEVDSDSEG